MKCPRCKTELAIVDAKTKADMVDGSTPACTVSMCLNCTWMRLSFEPSAPLASIEEKP